MKHVRVSPGKFVVVPTVLADKAARMIEAGALLRGQVRELAAAEPKCAGGVLLGKSTGKGVSNRPLPAKPAGRLASEPATGRMASAGSSRDRTPPRHEAK